MTVSNVPHTKRSAHTDTESAQHARARTTRQRTHVGLHGKKPTQEFVPFGEKVLARPITSEPLNRMNPRYKFGVWLGVRSNSAECFVGTAEVALRAREVRRMENQDRWDKEAINNAIGVPWRIADGKMDCGQAGDTN